MVLVKLNNKCVHLSNDCNSFSAVRAVVPGLYHVATKYAGAQVCRYIAKIARYSDGMEDSTHKLHKLSTGMTAAN